MIAILLAILSAAAPPRPSPSPAAAPSAEVLATVGGEPITARDLENAPGPRARQLRQQRYDAQRQLVEEVVNGRLLEKEAAARGTTTDALLKQEVEGKVPPVSEADQRAYYEQNKARIGNMPEAEALKRIESGMRQQRVQERRAAFLNELRQKAAVRLLLDPPRQAVEVGDDPFRGPADAPVTIVEFSDFQCPFCGRHFQQTYGQIDKEYIATGKARYVFRHFPIEQIHPQAFKAGEAAACAGAQNKFWEMHDVLFANQKALQPPDLVKHAQLLGLNGMTFDTCLAGQMAPRIRQDMTLAADVGVRATPTFFIGATLPNGNIKVLRRFNGAVAFTAFKTALDTLAASPATP